MRIFYPKNNVAIHHASWPIADGIIHESKGELFVFNNPCAMRTTLPVEFFSHQLQQLNTSDQNEVLAFVTEFGIPLHPKRFNPESLYYEGEYGHNLQMKPIRDAIALTDNVDGYFDEDVGRDEAGHIFPQEKSIVPRQWFRVSLNEIKASLTDLQNNVQDLFRYLRGETIYWNYHLVEDCSSNVYSIKLDTLCFPTCTLTQGICNQIIETLADETPWKICECDGCGRIFKHHQPRKGYSAKTGKNPSRSKYCCIKCQNRQGQRNKSHSAKNRITH